MTLRTTTIEPISETQSRVEMAFYDGPDEMAAERLVRVRVTVEHQENSSLAGIPAKALVSVRSEIGAEILRLGGISGLRPEEYS